jgi:integral membrane protein MviN
MNGVDKPKSRPIKTVAVMMMVTVGAKLLGVIRASIQASHYGIGMEANAFSQAYNIPLTFFDMLLSAAILGCFIPVYNSFTQDDKGKSEADNFASLFLNIITLVTGLLAILGILFAQPIINIMGAELDPETRILAVKLLRIMFPAIIFTGSTYILVGVLQSKGRYILPASISAVSNAVIIGYLLFFDYGLDDNRIYGLAVAYLLSWIAQLLILVIPLIRGGFNYRLLFDFKNPLLINTLKSVPPIMVGSWLAPFTLLTGLHFSAYVGNITVFDNSITVYNLITGILVHSLCNYIFPILSKLSVHGDENEFNKIVNTGLTASFAIMIPFMCMVFLLNGEGIAVLYMDNAYTPDAAYLTANTLRLMTIAMPAFALIEILNRVFYSKRLNKIPMIATLCGIAVNIITAVVLTGIDGVGVGAVSIAVAASQITAAGVLVIFLFKKIKGVINKKLFINAVKILISGIVSFLAMRVVYYFMGNNPYESGNLKNIIVILIIFAVGAITYIGGLFITRLKISE